MKRRRTPSKIVSVSAVVELVANYRTLREPPAVMFTNGGFGILHPGHAKLLNAMGTNAFGGNQVVIVAVNTDESYEAVKGRKPQIPWHDRALLLASLEAVDYVIPLEDKTPHALLEAIKPDVLMKGSTSEYPVGHEVVEAYGGKVVVFRAEDEYSTTTLSGERLRAAIIKHHSQRADDLCWMDDNELYAAAGLPPRDNRIGDPEAMLANCKRFIAQRCQPGGWPSYAQLEQRIKELENAALIHKIGGRR